jgi:hypothetical protein
MHLEIQNPLFKINLLIKEMDPFCPKILKNLAHSGGLNLECYE